MHTMKYGALGNTLDYYATTKISAVKSFIALAIEYSRGSF